MVVRYQAGRAAYERDGNITVVSTPSQRIRRTRSVLLTGACHGPAPRARWLIMDASLMLIARSRAVLGRARFRFTTS
jgi:hypothetical protein